jgi:hypothetical protein
MSYGFLRRVAGLAFVLLVPSLGQTTCVAASPAESIPVSTVRTLVAQGNVAALKNFGTGVLPVLVEPRAPWPTIKST